MKILIVGSSKPYALEKSYTKHFKELSVDVEIFNAHDLFLDYYEKSLLNKICFRFSLSNIIRKINHLLLDKITKDKYDVIWVFKGMEIFPKTLERLKKHCGLLACYNPDHPFQFHGRGSGNKYVKNSIEIYDVYGTYSLEIEEELKKKYNVKTMVLPFGYEKKEISLPNEDNEINRICFIGFADRQRADAIKLLLDDEIPVDVYGNNWNKYLNTYKNSLLKVHGPVFNDDYIKTAIKYKVQLNLLRPQNKNSHNMRTFEMPGLACIMLAPDSEEHQKLFTESTEAFFYQSSEEMIQKTRQILDLPYSSALTIRQAALQRSISSGYSYKSRTKQVLAIFNNLINE